MSENPIADLDIDRCRFAPEISGEISAPCVEVGTSGYGVPMSGALAFSSETIGSLLRAGKRVIGVSDVSSAGFPSFRNIGVIFCGKVSNRDSIRPFGHLACFAARYLCAFLDDRDAPMLALDLDRRRIALPDGSILVEGEIVTIDPRGRLWRGALDMTPPSADLELLACAHKRFWENHKGGDSVCSLAFHVQDRDDCELLYYGIRPKIRAWLPDAAAGESLDVGLWRTEEELRRRIPIDRRTQVFQDMVEGNARPDCLEFLNVGALLLPGEIHLRLADLHALFDIFPPDIQQELRDGSDHFPNSKAFALRKNLFRLQTRNAVATSATDPTPVYRRARSTRNKHIILPSIRTVDELRELKEVVLGELRTLDLADSVGVGAMVETTEALDDVEAIAQECTWLKYGTNDLTSAVTGLPRSWEGAAQWMRTRGSIGQSPFSTLVPEVLRLMIDSIQRARRANPKIHIGVCGHQVGGHDLPSVKEVLSMGVDQITIEQDPINAMRVLLTIAQHHCHLTRESCVRESYRSNRMSQGAFPKTL